MSKVRFDVAEESEWGEDTRSEWETPARAIMEGKIIKIMSDGETSISNVRTGLGKRVAAMGGKLQTRRSQDGTYLLCRLKTTE